MISICFVMNINAVAANCQKKKKKNPTVPAFGKTHQGVWMYLLSLNESVQKLYKRFFV